MVQLWFRVSDYLNVSNILLILTSVGLMLLLIKRTNSLFRRSTASKTARKEPTLHSPLQPGMPIIDMDSLFAANGAAGVSLNQDAVDPREEAFFSALKEASKNDPLVAAKAGSREISLLLRKAMTDKKGIHIESLLCVAGALAGFACQVSVRTQASLKGLPGDALFHVVKTEDGRKLYFGDFLNKPLAESQYSVWGLAAYGAQLAGCVAPEAPNEIFQWVSANVGTENFGKLRIPVDHMPSDTPINYLNAFWPNLFPIIAKYSANPEHWPIMLGLSCQEFIQSGKAVIDPSLALKIVMESAIPMSKVNRQIEVK